VGQQNNILKIREKSTTYKTAIRCSKAKHRGTPNAGSPAAETNDACAPAVFDLRPGANATKAVMNPNTKHHTIAGIWMPLTQGNLMIPGNDDGLVPVESVESQEYFQSLGQTEHGHAELLSDKEYQMSKDILLGKK
jgi:hypothetical protein